MPSRWKTSGLVGSRRARRRASASEMGGEMGRMRPTNVYPGCFAMAGDGAFQFGSEVRGTLFEQVLVLPSAGPIDGQKMSAGGMEAQTKTAKTRAPV